MIHKPVAARFRECGVPNAAESPRQCEHWDHSAAAAESRIKALDREEQAAELAEREAARRCFLSRNDDKPAGSEQS